MKKRQIIAGLAASVIAASMMTAVTASAASSTAYVPINGEKITFEKYITMENDANVPNIAFDFEAAPIDAVIPATADTLEVQPGPANIKFIHESTDSVTVDSTDPKKASVAFSNSDPATAESGKGTKTAKFSTPDELTDEKFAAKTMTLDLSDVEFTEPGVYRYVITEEEATGLAGLMNDPVNVRYLDIYVKDVAGDLVIDGSFLHTGDAAPKKTVDSTDTENGKSTGFSNSYETDNLIFSKAVSGNQGSKDKYFKFTVKLTNADGASINAADEFTVSGNWDKAPVTNFGTDYTTAEMTAANATNLTYYPATATSEEMYTLTYAQLSAGYDFYLRSGDVIQIKGIPSKLGYVVTESYEDYAPSVDMSAGTDTKTGDSATADGTAIAGVNDTAAKTFSVTDTFLKANARADFTNTREGAVPTGVIVAVAVPAVLSIAAFAGVVTIIIKRKKEDAEG